ncbi:hypothetical protein Ddye_022078 [Dipteronia dyeriana]|uniref:Protein kinase domain-containing protein n=1 Tax=Dipteronia dyeriana TaxID=168575 RepID=A0AAD9U3L9_9ROSI|nr:hypothetical protein Ddye_022078 [Dipteronia dyeriana]
MASSKLFAMELASSRLFFVHSCVLLVIHLVALTVPQQSFVRYYCLSDKGNNSRTITLIIVSAAVALVILIFSIYTFLRRRKFKENIQNMEEIRNLESLQFEFDTIRVATDNFSDANKLGQGGFGVVYKGMLSNGQSIAVKRLSMNSKQGDLEFKNEVLLLAGLQHRNLVRLLGFCSERKERILVYEFVPSSSLDNFIFGMFAVLILF